MTAPLRVLHVSAGNLYGGVERLLVTLAAQRGLCPAMEPHFACCFTGRLTDELRACGAAVHDLGAVRVSWPWTIWLARRRLRRLLSDGAHDVVVCHSAWPQAVFAPAVRTAGARLVFWLHGATDGRHWLERWARRTPPDLAVCNSRFTAGLLPHLYPDVRAEVVYCPVPAPPATSPERRQATRQGLGTPADAVVLLHASRLEALKGHALLLEALGRLREERRWVLWMAGGPQRPQEADYLHGLRGLAARWGVVDRVRFLDHHPDVAVLMAAADVYCQTNVRPEGFGLTFVEALDAGLPVVTTAMGGALEIVDETCGLLVEPEAGAVAAALQRLIAEPALRGRLGAAGPARARRLCDPAAQLRRLADLLGAAAPSRRVSV